MNLIPSQEWDASEGQQGGWGLGWGCGGEVAEMLLNNKMCFAFKP